MTRLRSDREGAARGAAPLVVLADAELALRDGLDRLFAGWGAAVGARATAYQTLLPVDALRTIDYWDNFPHLALLAAPARETGYDRLAAAAADGAFPPEVLDAAGYALPSAACYAAYLHLAGQVVPDDHKITTVATCFRRETHFEGLRRLLSFTMREIVCVGGRDAALEHLESSTRRLLDFSARLGLPLEVEVASDPFFDPNASRSVVAKLFPVKQEFVYRAPGHDAGLAIASVNFHRNFFGERCGITTGTGEAAYTSCVAFGLERWIAALTSEFGSDHAELGERLRAAA
ncbi:hypothetical protein SAMN05443575_3516 [Jatrophihabitans endophyticus]|uniref:Aminoacyl-tRNA synthetase class II (G/ P/ S/T) domain-containing protein n=1 Tax=Jatrophihabitans endophyticus TaxID=1206085 RepID=A0A1M5RE15_9ACTN|nr:aminoacyl--tRNA ligase-related protein [Jatrophihabitans endophyticus]SHH24259.1 hypothetical protein SAMN05443575_3516 [Jatrophihabitans endophyticus]